MTHEERIEHIKTSFGELPARSQNEVIKYLIDWSMEAKQEERADLEQRLRDIQKSESDLSSLLSRFSYPREEISVDPKLVVHGDLISDQKITGKITYAETV